MRKAITLLLFITAHLSTFSQTMLGDGNEWYYMTVGWTDYYYQDGVLNINGGSINSANVIVRSGGHVNINDGGTIQLDMQGKFATQPGAIININNGKILPYQ